MNMDEIRTGGENVYDAEEFLFRSNTNEYVPSLYFFIIYTI